MKNKNKNNFRINGWLVVILLLGIWLRLYRAGEAPHGFNADEAALGYNAYSLLETGRDEHGDAWPIHFKSFADFKPGGYIYLLLPFVKLFGLKVWVVRFPALAAGIFSIWLAYRLVAKLFPGERIFALLTAFGLAISPWHVQFSRGGWETTVGTAFLLGGSLLVWQGLLSRKNGPLFGGLAVFILSAYTYHSMRIVAPVLLVTLLLLRARIFFRSKKTVGLFFLVGLLLSAPLLYDLFRGGGVARFAGVGIIGDVGPFWSANRLRGEHRQMVNAPLVRLLHNRPITYAVKVAQNWSAHFNAEFLFIDGDKIRRSNAPGIGEMYWLDILGLLAGAFFLVKKWRREWIFILIWLLVAPLPAALTLQSPHALRTQSMVIPLAVLVGFGWSGLWSMWSRKRGAWLLVVIFLMAYVWQGGYFLDYYLIHYAADEPQVWEQGFDRLVPYLASVEDRYRRIYVTERYDQPYILFLFYRRYPPALFAGEHTLTERDKFGFSTVRDWGRYHFENINWEKLAGESNVLIVGTDEEIPETANIIHEICFGNGQPVFQIAEK